MASLQATICLPPPPPLPKETIKWDLLIFISTTAGPTINIWGHVLPGFAFSTLERSPCRACTRGKPPGWQGQCCRGTLSTSRTRTWAWSCSCRWRTPPPCGGRCCPRTILPKRWQRELAVLQSICSPTWDYYLTLESRSTSAVSTH